LTSIFAVTRGFDAAWRAGPASSHGDPGSSRAGVWAKRIEPSLQV